MMNLYLVQHGLAKSEEEDPHRSLSERGRAELQKITAFLERHGRIKVETVYHSGKARAEQTAEILAKSLKPAQGVKKAEGLAPMDDPNIWAEKTGAMREDTMLVGHLPHLSRLAALLLCNNVIQEVVQFRNAGIVCLNRDIDNQWTVEWIVTPGILP